MLMKIVTAPQGMWLPRSSWTRRPTLWDLYLLLEKRGKASIEDFISYCKQKSLLFGDLLKEYPRWLRHGFRAHEKRLESLLRRPKLVSKIAPVIRYHNKYYYIMEDSGEKL